MKGFSHVRNRGTVAHSGLVFHHGNDNGPSNEASWTIQLGNAWNSGWQRIPMPAIWPTSPPRRQNEGDQAGIGRYAAEGANQRLGAGASARLKPRQGAPKRISWPRCGPKQPEF